MKPPLAGWLGGKSRLLKQLLPMIPKHTCYVEVFGGAGWVLFGKEESKVEVLNDVNKDLVTMYRVLQNHIEEFLRYFKYVMVSRDDFERWSNMRPETLTDVQRAARFYYLIRNSFGGQCNNPQFGVSCTTKARLNLKQMEEDLTDAWMRLNRVFIENLSYDQLIKRYDRQKTFFYLDPPYYGGEDDYGKDVFSKAEYVRMSRQLQNIKGKFLLSINDTPTIRYVFNQFLIHEVKTKYSIANKGALQEVNELFISNYDLTSGACIAEAQDETVEIEPCY